MEWSIAKSIIDLIKQTGVKEVVSIEGVASDGGEDLYCFNSKEFEKLGATRIDESVIMGVTAALLVRHQNLKCIFAESHSKIPDSRAAAKVMEVISKYLKLDLRVEPLLMQAELFEKKLKDIMAKTNKTMSEADKKQLSYLG